MREADLDLIKFSRQYIYSITLSYCDTDSLGLYVVYTEKGKDMTHDFLFTKTILSKYIDRSNFKVLSKESVCEPCDLGYLKSEIADNIVEECIFLTPKVYSILSHERGSDNTLTKLAVRGCPVRVAEKLYIHDVFRKILEVDDYEGPIAESNHIRRDRINGVNTVRVKKKCISLLDNKRYWVSDLKSYGYSHPDIFAMGYKLGDVISGSGTDIKGTVHREIINDIEDEVQSDLEDDISMGSYNDADDFFSDVEDDYDDGIDFFSDEEDETLIGNNMTYNLNINDEQEIVYYE